MVVGLGFLVLVAGVGRPLMRDLVLYLWLGDEAVALELPGVVEIGGLACGHEDVFFLLEI